MDNKDNLFNEMNDPFEDIFKIFKKKEEEEKKVDENSSPKKEDVKSDIDEHPIFKNKEALEELRRKEEAKLRPGEDPFDAAFRIFDPEGKRKVEMPKPAPNRSEYKVPNYDDTIDLHKEDSDVSIELNTKIDGDSKKAVEFFGSFEDDLGKDSSYDRIRDNSVNNNGLKNNFSRKKKEMNPVLKGLITASVALSLAIGAGIFVVKSVDNFIDNKIIDRYGNFYVQRYSGYDYENVFYSDSNQMNEHVNAAIEFYDNMKDYSPQYRGLSIYQTYNSVKTNNRLQVMDGFLDALKLKNIKNDSIMISMSNYQCFLEYALSVVEKYEGDKISKYDKVIEEYLEMREKYPGEQPYAHLRDSSKKDVEKLMEQYRECSDELLVEFINMEKSGGHRR